MAFNFKMRIGACAGIILSASAVLSQGQELIHYRNTGLFSGRPELRADTFYNSGIFEIPAQSAGVSVGDADNFGVFLLDIDAPPFTPVGTLAYTNDSSGRMLGDFRFDNKSLGSTREPAEIFVNRGSIEARERVLISAETIINSGLIDSGPGGLLDFKGDFVDLSRGGLRASTPGELDFGGFAGRTNHIDPVGVFDYAWGVGTNGVMDASRGAFPFDAAALAGFPNFASPLYEVTNIFSFINPTLNLLPLSPVTTVDSVSGDTITNFATSVFTNAVSPTNTVIQVAFFRTNFTDSLSNPLPLTSELRWSPAGNSAVPSLRYELTELDVVSGTNVTESVFIEDRMTITPGTNLVLSVNIADTNTYRPNNFVIDRRRGLEIPPPPAFALGGPAVAEYVPDLFTLGFPVTLASNWVYSGYSAEIRRPGPLSQQIGIGQAVNVGREELSTVASNMLGRVQIEADVLDLTRARVRAENYLRLHANEIVGEIPRGIDARVFDLQLTSDSGGLTLGNVVPPEVLRFTGDMHVFSTIWTNTASIIVDDVDPDTGEPVQTTNTVETTFHVFIADPDFNFAVPTEIENLLLTSRAEDASEIVVNDDLNVGSSMNLQADNVVISGNLNKLNGELVDSDFEGTTNLVFNGSEAVVVAANAGVVNLGDPGSPTALANLEISNGVSVFGSQITLRADEMTLAGVGTGGLQASFGEIVLDAGRLAVSGGFLIESLASTRIHAEDLLLSEMVITTGAGGAGRLFLDVSNSISDGGIGGDIFVTDGIEMVSVPANGGDLGTTFVTSQIPRFRRVTHIWGGEDLGPDVIGFDNNFAIDTLTLQAADAFGEIAFSGVNGSNGALYVRFLELLGPVETDFFDLFDVADNFTIYFEEVISETGSLTDDDVDGAYGGRFRKIVTEGSADSGGDQVLVAPEVQVSVNPETGAMELNIAADPGATYRIDRADSIGPDAVWTVVDTVSNASVQGQTLTVGGLEAGEGSQTYFRVTAIE